MAEKRKLAKRDITDTLESLDTGEGVYISVGDAFPGGEVRVKFFASNQVPKLRVRTNNAKRSLKIFYSSIANDNEQLLHLLFGKTRKQ